jgi:hypothetical protein
VIETIIPMKNEASTEMLVSIICDLFCDLRIFAFFSVDTHKEKENVPLGDQQ